MLQQMINDMEAIRLRIWRHRDTLIAERDESDPSTGDKARYRRITRAMDELDVALSKVIQEIDRFLEEKGE